LPNDGGSLWLTKPFKLVATGIWEKKFDPFLWKANTLPDKGEGLLRNDGDETTSVSLLKETAQPS
jgi:hypothetical protein